MTKFFNDDDMINITCNEISKLSGDQSVYNRLRNVLRKDKDSKWAEASKVISNQESYAKSIKAVYEYIRVMCQIANQGCQTAVSPEKRNVRDVKSLESFHKNLGYKHDETGESWNGPDSADLYDAEESYNLAKKVLTVIK